MSTTEPTPSRGPALVGQVDWTAPPLRAALPAFAGALLLALAGLALPWVSGPHADRVIEAGSHAGREGGIGVLLALYALLAALVAAAVLLTGRARPAERPILIVGGLLALAWSVLETSEVGAYAYRAGVSGGPSIGGYVAGIGAVLVTAAGFLAPRDRRADHSNQENLALRWARRGRLLPRRRMPRGTPCGGACTWPRSSRYWDGSPTPRRRSPTRSPRDSRSSPRTPSSGTPTGSAPPRSRASTTRSAPSAALNSSTRRPWPAGERQAPESRTSRRRAPPC
ncbi:hypothetical protein [Thermobifida cellulosilytica]|uniref:hypothetical protein n=1 Tax=Thermobifida cellulosilytica TaxID=144786 RepID=UPI000A862318|nr:hypothetical protein [Thermobifida cellulosilytica]